MKLLCCVQFAFLLLAQLCVVGVTVPFTYADTHTHTHADPQVYTMYLCIVLNEAFAICLTRFATFRKFC